MDLKPTQYKFTVNDTLRIIDLGYKIKFSGSLPLFEDFVAQEFPNFDIYSLLSELEKSFTPTTNLTITREISYCYEPPALQISYINNFATDDEALVFDRKFLRLQTGIIVDHNMCVLPLQYQGKGLLKKVFQISLQQYINMGAKTIHVYAGLNGGGHVWARHGFVAVNKEEVKVILDDAKMHLSKVEYVPVERIFSTYYSKSPLGKDFPMRLWAMLDTMKPILRGARWHGVVNLDNSIQLRNFTDYVFRD